MNNVVFSSYYNSSGRCAETDIASYNGTTWVMATEKIKIVIATENTTWMLDNILTNNGALPSTGGHYGIRFEMIRRGKWTGMTNYLFIPFNSTNMTLQTYETTQSNHTVYTYVFTLNSITTKTLADNTIIIPTGYGYTYVFKKGSKIGSAWVKYLGKTVYIKGQANSLSTYNLQSNSYYSYNRYTTGTSINITNRFSAKMRVVFCSYNDIATTQYQAKTIPIYINSVEFNLVMGLTKTESDKADHYLESTTSNSNSDIVFIRGKQSRGRIPFSMNDFGI